MTRYRFEDFGPGFTHDCGSYAVTRENIVAFAEQYDPQGFHLDPKAGEKSIYGGLIASGWQMCAAAMRLATDAFLSKTDFLGSPGMDEIKWLKPVRPGDTVSLSFTVTDARPSRRKPDIGYATVIFSLTNQKDEEVLRMRGVGMFRRGTGDEAAS